MKTGNPKQAAILGVVAVGAIGFLGSSLFSTFASGSTPTPPSQEIVPPTDPATQPAPAPAEKLPTNEPEGSGSDEIESDLPPKIERTPFGKPPVRKPQEKSGEKQQPAPLTKTKKGREHSESAGESGSEPFDPTAGKNPELPPTGEMPAGGANSEQEDSSKTKPLMIRFEGYVDAGNPVAIIRIGDSQYTADQGEGLPYGIRVIAMTSEKLTLSIRGRRKSVWIGREVQL